MVIILKLWLEKIINMNFLNYLFPHYVQHVLLVATHQCNSRCLMCNIWQEHNFSQEMSLDEIKNVFAQDRFSRMETISFSGGEAMTRPDLVEIIKYFLETKKRLKNILVATNGLAPDLILEKLQQIFAYIKENKLKTQVWVQISCDGVNEVVDEIRGVPGAFQKINSLINELNKLKSEQCNLHVKVVFLTLPANVEQLEKITDYAKNKNIGCQISHLYLSREYYKNDENDKRLNLSGDQVNRIIEFLKGKKKQSIPDYYYNSLVRNMYLGENRKDDCLFLSPRGVFVEANGEVSFCMHSQGLSLGNLKENPTKDFWHGQEYRKKRKLVVKECCQNCKNSCGFNLTNFPKNFLRVLWQNLKNRNKKF